MNQRSGGAGIVGLAGLAAVFFLLRRFVPSLARVFLLLGAIAVLGIAALVAAVLFFAFRKPKEGRHENAASVLQQGRSRLMELRRLALRLRHPEIRAVSEAICSVIDRILHTLKEQPADIPRVGRFFHYYLPTLQSVLTKYARLEAHGIPAEDTAEKTLSCLKDMQAAMEKQYLNLFEDDKLDLSVEMEVLTQICRRDGLLADECRVPDLSPLPARDRGMQTVPPQEDSDITLTL